MKQHQFISEEVALVLCQEAYSLRTFRALKMCKVQADMQYLVHSSVVKKGNLASGLSHPNNRREQPSHRRNSRMFSFCFRIPHLPRQPPPPFYESRLAILSSTTSFEVTDFAHIIFKLPMRSQKIRGILSKNSAKDYMFQRIELHSLVSPFSIPKADLISP